MTYLCELSVLVLTLCYYHVTTGGFPPPPPFFFAITCFFCNNFQELQTVLFEVELIINNKPLRWLIGLKLIQLEQQKTQLPFIILAKNLKPILCRVIEGTQKSLNWK